MTEPRDAHLKGSKGSLQLRLVRYQFPSITDDDWDSNWLIVSGKATLEGREWQFVDPCLTNFEAAALADWLEAVVKGGMRKGISFTEPNLEFVLQEPNSIGVFFGLEALPPWTASDDSSREYGFDVTIGPHLSKAAHALRQQLAQFPLRGLHTQ